MRVDRAVKDTVQRVIVSGWDRIEFMIVAPCTSECQAHERGPEIVDRVFDRNVFQILRPNANTSANGQIPRANGLFPTLVVILIR